MRLRVIISQRCDEVVERDEVRDALDVRLPSLLWDLGLVPIPMASRIDDYTAYFDAINPEAVILSGGNNIGDFPERDSAEVAAIEYAVFHNLPVLGICRGMQMLNYYQGGNIRPVTSHVATRHEIHGPLVGTTRREVNSFHDVGFLEVDLGDKLEALAWTKDGVIEALRHQEKAWLGIMWHPERDVPTADEDLRLIRRHLEEVYSNLPKGKLS